jgi:periplasmic divalent cation tolerance protein
MMKETPYLVFCTCPSREEARQIVRDLVEKKLAACVNISNSIESIYSWQNKVETAEEVLLLIKTTSRNYQKLEKEIQMLHSYSVPEIIAITVEQGSSAYLDWVIESTR